MALKFGRVVLSSMAGFTDASFASGVPGIGMACLGGFAVDGPTCEASGAMEERGRREFPPMEVGEVAEEVESCPVPAVANVRTASVEPLLELAERGVPMEVNCHCRQPEMLEAGSGEALLEEPELLADWVNEVKSVGGVVGVKTRANVVDDAALAAELREADFLHVDAMGPEPGVNDPRAIEETREEFDGVVIANNSIRGPGEAEEMLEAGADAVSAARPALHEPEVFQELSEALEGYGEVEVG